MLLIPCPWCGPRDEIEFYCGGQASLHRPDATGKISAASWRDYLFVRDNPKGLHRERWLHRHGCRQWFVVVRNTLTHQIAESGK